MILTEIMSKVLSHTLRISVFLSCMRSMRYAGACVFLMITSRVDS